MKPSLLFLAGASACLGFAACDKSKPAPGPGAPETPGNLAAAVKAPAPLPVAGHLGVATLVPADVDLFVGGYDLFEDFLDAMKKSGFLKLTESEKPDGEDPKPYFGDEAFVFVGPGAGTQLQALSTSYRDLMASMTGLIASGMFEGLEQSRSPEEMSKWADGMADDLLDRLLDAVEKDSRLQVPSVVMGWRPAADKLQECSDGTAEALAKMFEEVPEAKPVTFEANGGTFTGFEVLGKEAFSKAIAEIRTELAGKPEAEDLMKKVPQERIERLVTALEGMRFTVAAGSLQGRVMIYLGNGKEGFRLATSPETSLAGSDDLKWTNAFAEKEIGTATYFSEGMVRSVLPLMDPSVYWEQIAKAVGPPVRNERVFRELLVELAHTEKELAQREASALSIVTLADQGWSLEARGGWKDPDLDYEAPLRMTDAALAQKPAIRAHWVQNRARKDLSWRKWETFGLIVDAAMEELKGREDPTLQMMPTDAIPEFMAGIRAFNRAYREEFRAGIGDEVALVADFKGDMPTVPGMSEEEVRDVKIPRFIYARDVKDQVKIDAAGSSFLEAWKDLTAVASKTAGQELPLLAPQKVESDRLETWFIPLPFIGGDFVPGVSLNERVWMLGTSRELAEGMAKSMETPASGSETGMLVEIDLAPVWNWIRETSKFQGVDAGSLLEGAPEEMKDLAAGQDLDKVGESVRELQGLSYRKWLEQGKPRVRLHVKFER